MTTATLPSLYEWAGGEVAFAKLFKRFYERVPADALLAPVFEAWIRTIPNTSRRLWRRCLAGPLLIRRRAALTPE